METVINMVAFLFGALLEYTLIRPLEFFIGKEKTAEKLPTIIVVVTGLTIIGGYILLAAIAATTHKPI